MYTHSQESVSVNFDLCVEMWKEKGVGKNSQCGMKCVKIIDHNLWCEYSVAEIVVEESTYTVLSEAPRV